MSKDGPKAGILQENGKLTDRFTGTPQGGVVSPLLSNIFLHVVFDKWMEKHHPEKPYELRGSRTVL